MTEAKHDANDDLFTVATDLLQAATGREDMSVSDDSHPVSNGTDENVFYGMHPQNATQSNSAFTGLNPNGGTNHAIMATLKTSDSPFNAAVSTVLSFVEAYEQKKGRHTGRDGNATPIVWKDAAITVAMRYYVPFLHELDAGLESGRFADSYDTASVWEQEQKIDWMSGDEGFQMKISYTGLPRTANTEHTLVRRWVNPNTGEVENEKVS